MSGRRELTFSNFAEVVADIEAMAEGNYHTIGNHSFPKIVYHLARTNEMLVGRIKPPKLPWYMRMMMPVMRSRILNGPVKPGFTLPSTDMQSFFWGTEEPELDGVVEQFRGSVKAYETSGPLPAHPLFGKATPDQILSMALKHAAMHLSFVQSDA